MGAGMATNSYMAAGPVVRRVRGYFAPVNRVGGDVPSLFDAAAMATMSLDTPAAPWVSLGWIAGFVRKAESRIAPVMTGVPAGVQQQVRESVEALVSFRFLSWTKLALALASGSQQMNVLAEAGGAAPAAEGGTGLAAVAIQSGATASFLPMAAVDAAKFTAGQMVAVDVDFVGQTGFVGLPTAGAYVKPALAGVLTDANYVRQVTLNVARVAAASATGLALAGPLPAGAPVTAGNGAMKVSLVTGFVDREGGSFFQEWSALFVMEGTQGERVIFYYPRLQGMGSSVEALAPLDGKNGGSLEQVMLAGVYRALPVIDGLDGERVVCYRGYLPGPNALV